MATVMSLADLETHLKSSDEEQCLSCDSYCWDVEYGFRNYSTDSSSLDCGCSTRKQLAFHIPLTLFEVAAPSDSDTVDSSSQGSSKRSASQSRLTPVFAPTPTQEEPAFAWNRTRPLTNLCTCEKPEPVLRHSASVGDFLNERLKRKSERLIVSCVCKFNPIVENAQAMIVPARSGRARIVSNGPLTALPAMEDSDDRSEFRNVPVQRPHSAPSSGGQTSSTSSRPVDRPEPIVSVEEIPEADQQSHDLRSRNVSLPSAVSHRSSNSGLLSSDPKNPNNTSSGPQDIESASPSSRHDKLRRHLFKLSLWCLLSNITTLVMLLIFAILFLWPAIESAPFPQTNYAWAPQLVSLVHRPTNGKPGPAANVTSVTSEVIIAKIATAGVPQILVDEDTDLARNKADLNTVVTSSTPTDETLASTTKNTTTKTAPKLIPDPEGHFANGPFWRTLHAEFRTAGYPALVLGLSLLYLLQLFGQLWSAICLGGALDGTDEWARTALDGEKGKSALRFPARILGVWREWKRGAAWSSHRGQCIWAARVDAWYACVRCAFVVLVLVVLACVASVKAGVGKGAP